jgi:hypothetical protein
MGFDIKAESTVDNDGSVILEPQDADVNCIRQQTRHLTEGRERERERKKERKRERERGGMHADINGSR